MKEMISTIAKTIFWVCMCLALIAFVFQTEAFTAILVGTIAAILKAIMLCVITVVGLYIIIKALFR